MPTLVTLATLEWLKKLDREDANKHFFFAMHAVDCAQTCSSLVHGYYMSQAKDDFERALKHLERIAELNLNGRSTMEIR